MEFLKLATTYEVNHLQVPDKMTPMQFISKQVGGTVENISDYFDLPDRVEAWANKDGKAMGLTPTLGFGYADENDMVKVDTMDYICGNIIFTGMDESENIIGITKEQENDVMNVIRSMPALDFIIGKNKQRPLLFKVIEHE